ncbi:MAG: DUF951 domain-containing protein [Clostridia bacterium]|nr:DUF951 domain-containing protein [Clostridia bacterium]
MIMFCIGDTVTTRKKHACGCDKWVITRVGADYKIKCNKCGRTVMLASDKFHKAVKNVDVK